MENATKVEGNICRKGRLLNVVVASEKEMTAMISLLGKAAMNQVLVRMMVMKIEDDDGGDR